MTAAMAWVKISCMIVPSAWTVPLWPWRRQVYTMKAVFGMLNVRQGSVRLGDKDITNLSPQDG